MSYRMFLLATFALAMFAGGTVLAAAEFRARKDRTHDGKLVSVTSDKLVMTGKDGNERSHTLARNVRVTVDGRVCQPADLKSGTKIRVTTRNAEQPLVIRIEGFDKDPAFAASNRHDGKLVSISDDRLVMKGTEGSDEHTYALAVDAKITCDGIVCRAADLKPGMRIRVTTDRQAAQNAIQVESLDKDPDFAAEPANPAVPLPSPLIAIQSSDGSSVGKLKVGSIQK
jgi:hypothetical protein